jgi:16S rRNA (guanine527-N7)-methyltransferase
MNEPDPLQALLRDAQRRGAIGPGPIEETVEHARGFFRDAPSDGARCADLGSGGGIPGLILATTHPGTRWVLIESRQARIDRLQIAVARLGIGDRVEIVGAPAEEFGRGSGRGTFDIVTARGFGPPAVTAECASPLLRIGGRLNVSVTVEQDGWLDPGLRMLGLEPKPAWTTDSGSYRALEQVEACPDRFPRRAGVPRQRPLF